MKITKQQLKRIIREELGGLDVSGNVGTGEETYTREPTMANRLEDMYASEVGSFGEKHAAYVTWRRSKPLMDELGEHVDDLLISLKKYGADLRQLKALEKLSADTQAFLAFAKKHRKHIFS